MIWYQHETWDDEIEQAFFSRLKKARSQRDQYLAIQVFSLAQSRPEVSIRLAQHYFETRTGKFNDARVLAAQGNAHKMLGNAEDALASYQAALSVQSESPSFNAISGTAIAYYIATEEWEDKYDLALSLLQEDSGGSIWPVAVFSWNAAMALIMFAKGKHDDARRFSLGALDAASVRQTELTYHREVGLVDESFAPIVEKLRNIMATTDLQ